MMPRACRHNLQGGVCSTSRSLSSLSYSPEAEGEAQAAEHMGGFEQWPPRCINPRAEAGVWVVPGPALQWHRDCFWQGCCHTPHKWSHSSFTKGSKNICWVIKGSHSTAYVLARLSDSLKSPV